MCGRFAQKSPARKISKQFKVEEGPPLVERYAALSPDFGVSSFCVAASAG